ncbi:DNA polymerase beta superfamily protein [Modestobacter roseus]|uniref:Putative nucleotidyltransferase n=1 Tax=Modestobacter roseus TaxID=1181884 RepID=A0A562ILF3_9ACTN|nr:nucleotidyltransferase domain-containing protein [Modestobacter roseus]MQA36111.1 nucleotidyltransferase [Modestobacter roseus]TWH71851.1 putative nucleotidyltransferase [Modestobacter roseus]
MNDVPLSDADYVEAHPHSSRQARAIAEAGTILRVQVGSGVHGTAVDGSDDRDEMGVCLEPPAFVTGIARVPNPVATSGSTVPFEQWEYHTAWQRAGGLANRSGAGDLDVIVYSARKYAQLAASGNPTVLLPLFVPDAEIVTITEAGRELRDGAAAFASMHAAQRFSGYMTKQRYGISGERGRTNRPELVAEFGYDCKYAMHALRLGVQGIEYLSTGRITLPVPEPHLTALREVRLGQWSLADVLAWYDDLDAQLAALAATEPLPREPDRAWIDAWLHRSYTRFWAARA